MLNLFELVVASAPAFPENMGRRSAPSFTVRPSVAVSCFSIAGRNVLALTKTGINAAIATTIATTAKRIFAQRFTKTFRLHSFKNVNAPRNEKYMTSGRRRAVWALGERRDELQEEGGSPG